MCEAVVLMQTVTGWISKDSTLDEKPGKKQQTTQTIARLLSSVWVRGCVNRSPGHTFLRVT